MTSEAMKEIQEQLEKVKQAQIRYNDVRKAKLALAKLISIKTNGEITLCQSCGCMTKTIDGNCGKCKANKEAN